MGLPKPVPPPEASFTPEEPSGGNHEDPEDPDDESKKEEYPQCQITCTEMLEIDGHTITTTTNCATKAECTPTITTCSGEYITLAS